MDRLKRFLPLIVLACVIALIFGMGWNRYLSLDTLRDHGAELRAFTAEHYVLALLILMAIFAIATASVVPGVFFVTITAGYLFGPWVGGVSTSIAATVGALIVYAVARSALGQALRKKAERDKGMMQEGLRRHRQGYLLVCAGLAPGRRRALPHDQYRGGHHVGAAGALYDRHGHRPAARPHHLLLDRGAAEPAAGRRTPIRTSRPCSASSGPPWPGSSSWRSSCRSPSRRSRSIWPGGAAT